MASVSDSVKLNPITEGNLRKALLYFFAPIFLSSLIQQSYSIVDALIVGNFAGKEALAAVDATYVLIKLLINVFLSVAAGGSILIAQHYGAKRHDEVARTVRTLMRFSFLVGVIITSVGTTLTPYFVGLMQVPADIFDSSVLYLRIYFAGALFSLFFNICSGVLRASGDSKRPFYYMLISSISNVLLDLVLVAFFRWNIAGVAAATVISQAIAAVLVLSRIVPLSKYGGEAHCGGCEAEQRNPNPGGAGRADKKTTALIDPAILRQVLRLGIPMGITTVLYAISNMYMQGAINSYGTDGIAGWAICGKLDLLVWSVTDTMGITVTTFMAQNFGAGKFDRMKAVIRIAAVYNTIVVGIISGVLYVFGVSLAGLFNGDPGVLETVAGILSRVAPFYVLYIVGELLHGAIRGYGETFVPMLLTLIGTCLFRVVWIVFALPTQPSFYTVMWGYPASWAFTALLFLCYYFLFFMRRIRCAVQ